MYEYIDLNLAPQFVISNDGLEFNSAGNRLRVTDHHPPSFLGILGAPEFIKTVEPKMLIEPPKFPIGALGTSGWETVDGVVKRRRSAGSIAEWKSDARKVEEGSVERRKAKRLRSDGSGADELEDGIGSPPTPPCTPRSEPKKDLINYWELLREKFPKMRGSLERREKEKLLSVVKSFLSSLSPSSKSLKRYRTKSKGYGIPDEKEITRNFIEFVRRPENGLAGILHTSNEPRVGSAESDVSGLFSTDKRKHLEFEAPGPADSESISGSFASTSQSDDETELEPEEDRSIRLFSPLSELNEFEAAEIEKDIFARFETEQIEKEGPIVLEELVALSPVEGSIEELEVMDGLDE